MQIGQGVRGLSHDGDGVFKGHRPLCRHDPFEVLAGHEFHDGVLARLAPLKKPYDVRVGQGMADSLFVLKMVVEHRLVENVAERHLEGHRHVHQHVADAIDLCQGAFEYHGVDDKLIQSIADLVCRHPILTGAN